jgi:hypothetical protein
MIVNFRYRSGLAAILLVAALSFAAGRLMPNGSEVSAPVRITAPVIDDRPNEVNVPIVVPTHLPDVVTMPFREAYAILKAAPEEKLRSYFSELQQKRPKPTRYAAMTSFFKTLIHVNPRLTREMILQLKKDDRWPAMYAIREASPPGGMRAVAEVLLGFDRMAISSCSWDMLRDTLDEWGKNDPLALKEFIESHRTQDVDRYLPTLIRNWAAYDPEAAQKWMQEEMANHPAPPPGDENLGDGWTSTMASMTTDWIAGFLENDPEAAINYVLEHANEPAIKDSIESFAGDLFAMSPDRARDFLSRLPEEQLTAGLLGINRKANRFIRSDEKDNTASPRFVAEWMMRSFPDAWQQSFDNVLLEWKYGNAQELFAWMSDLPANARDTVVRKFPTFVFEDKPSEDFDLIMQVRDPALRDALLETLARGTTMHGKLLVAVLEKASLPPGQKAHLINLVPPEETFSESEDTEQKSD